MENEPILEIQDLVVKFHTLDGVVHAVNGVSYSLDEGKTLGVVGESGCGKSVSVLSVMRLIQDPPGKIWNGKILLRGKNILEYSESQMERIRGAEIAMIFQDPMTSLNPVLTIGKQISESMVIHLGMTLEEANARAIELLNIVGIPNAKDRIGDYPHQFSGGMRQRAMIAMALSCNPEILIADEPTTALDVTIQAQIVDLVRRLRDQLGMSAIWITHDLAVVADLADKVVVMYAGFIVEEADVYRLYENPLHPYTISLLKSLPRVDSSREHERLATIPGSPPTGAKAISGCPFVPRCKYVIDRCRIENPQLEQIESDHKMACWVDINNGRPR